jgi:hypothetical protein
MKTYKIDPQERQNILEMHINATKRQYLSEQNNEVQGTLKSADRSSMIGGYKELLDKIANDKQMFVIANTDGNVTVGSTPSSQLKGKFFTPSDNIKFVGNGTLVVYPKGMVDQQFMVQPKNGKLMLFVGA